MSPPTVRATGAEGGSLQWAFDVDTPIGKVRSRIEIGDDALRFASDDPFGSGTALLPWHAIRAAGTARMAAMGGIAGRGGPDLPGWMPDALEWLLVAPTDPGAPPFMRRLPIGADRGAIVAALRERLGARWLIEGAAVPVVQAALGMRPPRTGYAALAMFVVAVLASIVLAILLLAVLLAVLVSPLVAVPGGLVLGAWLSRLALRQHRTVTAAAGLPSTRAATADGWVCLEGRALVLEPSRAATIAPVSGQASLWWDATVEWLEVGNASSAGGWEQAVGRFDGRIDHVLLDDGSGRLPVWLQGAQLLLEPHVWDSAGDDLPAAGAAWLSSLGFDWRGTTRLRVTERRLAVGGPLHVFGTVEERGRLPAHRPTLAEKIWASLRTGRWRLSLVAAVPQPLRPVLAVLIGYADLLTRLGWGQQRSMLPEPSTPPALAASDRLVWKGSRGLPLLVSDRPRAAALTDLRWRTWGLAAAAALAVGGAVWSLLAALHGGGG